MNPTRLRNSIAYCGLICDLCFLAAKCDGCKSEHNQCERNCSDRGCEQRACCQNQLAEGCWECQELRSCLKGIYGDGDFSKVKAFAICIQEDGMDQFIEYVIRNSAKGLSVEKGNDYDGKAIPEVLELLRSGLA